MGEYRLNIVSIMLSGECYPMHLFVRSDDLSSVEIERV